MKKIDKSSSQIGATIVETIFVVAVVVALSFVIIANFPATRARLELSQASYNLAQKMKAIQNMALSNNPINDSFGNSIAVNGYGVFVNLDESRTGYIVYANLDEDPRFNEEFGMYCDQIINPQVDCVLEKKNISDERNNLVIRRVNNSANGNFSANFLSQSGLVYLGSDAEDFSSLEIVIGLQDNKTSDQKVLVNSVGLIEVKKDDK